MLTDSVIAAGGTCRAVDEVIPIPPHLYALMLQLDPKAPNDINKLSAWLARMGQKYLKKPIQKKLLAYLIGELDKWLAKTVPGTCPEIQEEINAVIEDDVEAELVAAAAAGACRRAWRHDHDREEYESRDDDTLPSLSSSRSSSIETILRRSNRSVNSCDGGARRPATFGDGCPDAFGQLFD